MGQVPPGNVEPNCSTANNMTKVLPTDAETTWSPNGCGCNLVLCEKLF